MTLHILKTENDTQYYVTMADNFENKNRNISKLDSSKAYLAGPSRKH